MSKSERHQTPSRHVRIPDERWKQAKAKAESEGKSITDVINEALERYLRKGGT